MDLDTSELDVQIAALQAAKAAKLAKAERARREQEKEDSKILVGLTPTKASVREKAKEAIPLPPRPSQPNFFSVTKSKSKPPPQALPSIAPPGPSGMTSSLAALRRSNSSSHSPQPQVMRTASLTQRPTPKAESSSAARSRSPDSRLSVKGKEPVRDEDSLTVIENLALGPKEFGRDPEGEEEWRSVEPNSGIRLSKRILPHASVQDHMYGRYYITPSQLYSVIRMSRDGTTYDIPVEGDWITIAVVAQRGEVKVSGTKDGPIGSDDEDDHELLDEEGIAQTGAEGKATDEKTKKMKSGKDKEHWKKRRIPRKYINFTLCSLPPRNTKLGTSGPTGDALLQLLMFEADAVVREETDEDGEVTRTYRGGSGGAYERWCNLAEGSVIAILNPRVWRNLRGGNNGPHPLEFPLGLNPTSGDAIALIGQARDLGCCSATQKDGNRCKTWVDLRQSQVCEYHVHAAVQRGRAGRAEFTASTSSFALSSRGHNLGKGVSTYDYKRKTGLLPRGGAQSAPKGLENGGGGATYVVGGGVINTSSSSLGGLKGFGEEYLSEKLGRNRANKRKRQQEEKEAEKVLERLLERDGGASGGSTGGKYLALLDKGRKGKDGKSSGTSDGGAGGKEDGVERKRPFSASAIKRIGFDPTARMGVRDGEDIQKRLEAIASLNKEPGCRLERLSKRLAEEKANATKHMKLQAANQARTTAPVTSDASDEEGMIDLD